MERFVVIFLKHAGEVILLHKVKSNSYYVNLEIVRTDMQYIISLYALKHVSINGLIKLLDL